MKPSIFFIISVLGLLPLLLAACAPAMGTSLPFQFTASPEIAFQTPNEIGPSATPVPQATVTPVLTQSPIPTDEPTSTSVPIVSCPGLLPSRLTPGGFGIVNIDPPGVNNLRANPDRGADKVGELPSGSVFRVLAGPKCANGYTWYQAQTFDKTITGWTVEADAGAYAASPLKESSLFFITGSNETNGKYTIKKLEMESRTPVTLGSFAVDVKLPYSVLPSPDFNNIVVFSEAETRLMIFDRSGVQQKEVSLAFKTNRIYWAPNGKKFFTGYEIIDTNGVVLGTTPLSMGCVWAHDSSMMVCHRIEDLFVIELDGKEFQITNDPSLEVNPRFSPDDSQIAYIRSGGILMVVNRDGTSPRELHQGGLSGSGSLAWSPNGDQMASDCGAMLCLTDLKSSKTQTFLKGAYDLQSIDGIAWSPDGSRFTFALSNPGGVNRRYVYYEGNITEIQFPKNADQFTFYWSPDGNRLLFSTFDGIYTISAVGTAPTKLTDAVNLRWMTWIPKK
jgi:WD40 repeat protein